MRRRSVSLPLKRHTVRLRTTAPLLGALAALVLLGCTALEEHEHCKTLALLLDPPLAEIQGDVRGRTSFTPEQLIVQAERYETLAENLLRERNELGMLQKNIRNLAAEFQGVARSLRDAAKAQTQGKVETYRSAEAQLRFTNQRIQDLTSQLGRRCQAR